MPKDSGHGKAVVPSAHLLDTQAIQQQDHELQQAEEAAAMAASTKSGQGLHLGWLFIFALMFGLLFIVAYFVCLAFVQDLCILFQTLAMHSALLSYGGL